MAILSDAIERCEQMVERMVVTSLSNDISGDTSYYMAKNLELIGMKNQLLKKRHELMQSNYTVRTVAEGKDSKPAWWKFWLA